MSNLRGRFNFTLNSTASLKRSYKLGGYQVLKKWLSYRERPVLGRALTLEEALYFAEVAWRIGAIGVPAAAWQARAVYDSL